MSAMTRLRQTTSLEESESAMTSATGSPSFSPMQNNSSRTSLASDGSSSALDKEEAIKSTMELDEDTYLVAPVLNGTEVPVATVDKKDSRAALPQMPTSDDGLVASVDTKLNEYGRLTDTYGNNFELPTFTIKDIRDAIPKHCYERSGARFLTYVARDVLTLAATFLLAYKFNAPEYVPNTLVRGILWAAYGFINGCNATGLWVLAHECGHQSPSPSKTFNDTVGYICHTVLLVPYFSWKISHGKHHKATGNIERDMVFVPSTREEYASKMGYLMHEVSELMEDTPLMTAGTLVGQQLLGWPLYLIKNVTGHNHHERQIEGRGVGKKNGFFGGVNHFNPSSPLYEAKDARLILASDVGLAVVVGALLMLGKNFGWGNLALWYFMPYLWVNHWLVAITYLQHTDPTLPHYADSSVWNFARGAAATIDRDLGFVGRHMLHGIIETHVLHHFVSTIPFYHADEASEAIKPVLGPHYRSDVAGGAVGFIQALWNNSRICQWLEAAPEARGDGTKVLFYRNRNGLGLPPAKITPAADVVGNKKQS